MFFLLPCDQKWLKASLVHTCQLTENNGKLKQNVERYGVREGSPIVLTLDADAMQICYQIIDFVRVQHVSNLHIL